jgi:predicted nucleic acid-binding protein
MKIIVDTNAWSKVFSASDKDHQEFKPVLDAIRSRTSILQWGGSKYLAELRKCPRYLGIHKELLNQGLALRANCELVDESTAVVASLETDPDFDDAHLIGLQIVTKSQVVCTHDARCHRFLKKASLYPKKHRRPKIYAGLASQSVFDQRSVKKK